MAPTDTELIGEAFDPNGNRVVLPAALWHGKVLRRHADLAAHLPDVLRAVSAPDHAIRDPAFPYRRRHYLRNVGPSRWLMVVLSYEQEPVRLISAFANRKDPPLWNK